MTPDEIDALQTFRKRLDSALSMNYKLFFLYAMVLLIITTFLVYFIVQMIRLLYNYKKQRKELKAMIKSKIEASQSSSETNPSLKAINEVSDNEVYKSKTEKQLIYNYDFDTNLSNIMQQMKSNIKSGCYVQDEENILSKDYDNY